MSFLIKYPSEYFQDDSVFNLRRPYDLVAFMRQEEREKMLGNLKNELLNRKAQIEKNEDRDSGNFLAFKISKFFVVFCLILLYYLLVTSI